MITHLFIARVTFIEDEDVSDAFWSDIAALRPCDHITDHAGGMKPGDETVVTYHTESCEDSVKLMEEWTKIINMHNSHKHITLLMMASGEHDPSAE